MAIELWRLTISSDFVADFRPLEDAVGHTEGAECICGPDEQLRGETTVFRHHRLDRGL